MAGQVEETLERLRAARGAGRHQVLCQVENQPETQDALSCVRRYGPGRLRGAALDALMYLGGEAALDEADSAAVRRLIRIRQRTDPVGPVMSCSTTWWCIRSDDQSAVIATLGLTDPRSVTYSLACTVVDIIEHDDPDWGLVYVGPAINGWVPLVGPWCDAFGERPDAVRATVERLSAEYGETHAFYFGAQGDGSAWLVARTGVTVRRYSSLDPQEATGDPLPIEQEWMAEQGIPGRPEDHLSGADPFADAMWDFCEANDVAASISIDVGWHHPRNASVSGHPVLASLPGAGPRTMPPGAHEI